jgi:hypothetical protein
MKHTEVCKCEKCGEDLYSKKNIVEEIKATLGKCYCDTIPEKVGRPTYVVLVGDTGLCVTNSPMFNGGDDILIDCLEITIKQLRDAPRESVVDKKDTTKL